MPPQDDTQTIAATETPAPGGAPETPDESALMGEFFADRGITTTTAGIKPTGRAYEGRAYDPDDPEDAEPEIEAAEEPEPEAEPTPPATTEEAEESPATAGFYRRRVGELERTLQANDQYVNALLAGLALEGRAPAAPAATSAPAAEQAPPDLFTDPDGWAEHKFGALSRPLHEKIGRLEQENAQLRGERTQEKGTQLLESVIAWGESYETESPGHLDRVNRYKAGVMQDLTEQGLSEAEARQMWEGEFGGMLKLAITRNLNFPALLDKQARRFLGEVNGNGAAPAARPTASARPDGRIAAAQRAQASGATSSVTQGGGAASSDVTIDTVRRSGLAPAKVSEILGKPGGREEFLRLMREAEKGAQR